MKNHTLPASCLAAILLTGSLPGSGMASAQTVQTTTTTSTAATGTITDFNPGMITVRTEAGVAPLQYSSSKTTTYVDEAGNPVSVETVKSGLPVQVYYTKVGDVLVANRVVVKRTVVEPAPVPVVPAQVIEKKTTTTTTIQK